MRMMRVMPRETRQLDRMYEYLPTCRTRKGWFSARVADRR